MQKNVKPLNFKKAIFPAIMTIVSFVSFVWVYWVLTYKSITPYYFKALLFTVPFIFFGVITYLTAQGRLNIISSSVITGISVIALGIGFFFILMFLSFDIATTETKDIGKYERVLRLTDDSLTQHFPKQIPKDAENVYFMHQPRFMQGGEILELSFQTDLETIQNYKEEFSKQAEWIGQNGQAPIQEYEFLTWGELKKLPEDFTLYIFSSKPYRTNDWNHGKFSIAAINEKDNKIIFLMENW
ncbi:MAG TPA: hypothetical protein VFC60_01475 [Tissierellaceae bacterium]|nr:hypothetical protein [Tissierellaceae bacterium]